MLVVTSLMYSENIEELEKQKKAIRTWSDIGFNVISCNVQEEIDQLRVYYPDLSFHELKRSGKEITGKPFPFIYDMLQILEKNSIEDEICGIINSDIFLKGIDIREIENHFIYNDNSILIFHRYDINTDNDIDGEYYFSGIDVFFFLKKIISIFPDKKFMLGRPEWDHWFLYEAEKNGIKILEWKNKVAFHIKHVQRWTAKDSTTMVVKQKNVRDNISFDEEYYYKTNTIMSDLSNRILKNEGKFFDSIAVEKRGNYYVDVDRDKLLEWEKRTYHYDRINEATGVLYFKDRKAYRICILHRKEKINENGTFSLAEIHESERPKGNILKYIDFKKFDFVKELGRTYLYPAGRASRLLADCLKTYEIPILGFIDRDISLRGKKFLEKEIFDLSALEKEDEYDHIIIISNLYVKEIYNQMCKIVDKKKLIVL